MGAGSTALFLLESEPPDLDGEGQRIPGLGGRLVAHVDPEPVEDVLKGPHFHGTAEALAGDFRDDMAVPSTGDGFGRRFEWHLLLLFVRAPSKVAGAPDCGAVPAVTSYKAA